ncbi:MAG: PDZ domain-containing protein [Planctomycetes bacterium]|nr:PDZ domain-containing protein [Planctomycetota bacterium]
MSLVRRLVASVVLLGVLASGAVARAQGLELAPKREASAVTIDWVKNYLIEVKNHLKESYVKGSELRDPELVAACVRGLEKAASDKEFGGLDKAARKAFVAWLRAGEWTKVGTLVDDLSGYLGEQGLELNLEKLADGGAKEMVASVRDPYSHIFDAEEIQKLVRTMMGETRDESLGLSIKPEDGTLKVAYVMYGYVAYENGVEIGDEVLAVNGTAASKMTPLELNTALQAKPGMTVTLTLRRAGWSKPYDFVLAQKVNKTKDVVFKVLPGGIGYLRMTIFDMALGASVRAALDRMAAKGMRALVLDLRHNPGGALNAAVDVADEFIKGKHLITKTESNYKVQMPFKIPGMPEMAADFYSGKSFPYEEMPMVVLVDHASASASELLTGALQDLKRARVIGETTYGKGVGQTAIPLWKTGFPLPQRFLYLTVMRYYLPTGRSIHGTGVVPDLAVDAERPTPAQWETLRALADSGAVQQYLDANWAKHSALFEKLADYDGFETARYPGFAAWHRSLQQELTTEQARAALREGIRRKLQSDKNFRYACDLETDAQLQTAVLELSEVLGGEAKADAR